MQRVLAPFAVVLLLAAANLRAATITSIPAFLTPGFSTGSVGPVGATPAPNNDNAAAASPNVIPYSIFFNTFGTLETEFAVADSGGTTEYRFTQTFVNNTGVPWQGFLFELGFGTGTNFVAAAASGSLDFDTPTLDPGPASPAFPAVNHQPHSLTWSGGLVPSIGGAPFSFAIDVPDGLQTAHPAGQNRFTLRQTPIAAAPVPEPATAALMVTALVCLAVFRTTRKRQGQ